MSENVRQRQRQRQRQRKHYQIFEKLDVTSLSKEYADLRKDQHPYFVIVNTSKNFVELFCKFFKPVSFKKINQYTYIYTKSLVDNIISSMKLNKKFISKFKREHDNKKKDVLKKLGEANIIYTENKLHELCNVNVLACNALMNLESKDKLGNFRKLPSPPVPLQIRTSSPSTFSDNDDLSPKNLCPVHRFE